MKDRRKENTPKRILSKIWVKFEQQMDASNLNLFVVSLVCLILANNSQFVNSFNFDTEKVVIHRPPYLKNTNFGYTVAGYSVLNDSWIIVGAPLTIRDRQYHKSSVEGAIYRCKINVQNSCFMLPFDKRGKLISWFRLEFTFRLRF